MTVLGADPRFRLGGGGAPERRGMTREHTPGEADPAAVPPDPGAAGSISRRGVICAIRAMDFELHAGQRRISMMPYNYTGYCRSDVSGEC